MIRRIIQITSTILFNSFYKINPPKGVFLYQGKLKNVCVPFLNCYSCPLAVSGCPIGSFQQMLKIHVFPFFITGFFGIIGLLSGRFVCGWLCPFGLLQEFLFKVNTYKMRLSEWSRYIKYIVLLLTILVPFFFREPFFCKFICPAGTFEASIWQIIMQPVLINSIGFFFTLKYMFLLLFIAGSITYKRFFCVTLCPIGAIYGLFNKISLLQIKVDKDKCTACDNCTINCPMDIPIHTANTHFDCIRCMECVKSCPHNAITTNLILIKKHKVQSSSN